MYKEAGDLDKALQTQQQNIRYAEKHFQSSSPEMIQTRLLYAIWLLEAGKTEESSKELDIVGAELGQINDQNSEMANTYRSLRTKVDSLNKLNQSSEL